MYRKKQKAHRRGPEANLGQSGQTGTETDTERDRSYRECAAGRKGWEEWSRSAGRTGKAGGGVGCLSKLWQVWWETNKTQRQRRQREEWEEKDRWISGNKKNKEKWKKSQVEWRSSSVWVKASVIHLNTSLQVWYQFQQNVGWVKCVTVCVYVCVTVK